MRNPSTVVGMLAVMMLTAALGCARSQSASPWRGLVGGEDEENAFGASLTAGLPDGSSPSFGEKIQAAFTRDAGFASAPAEDSRSLPRVDAKTGDLAQARLLERRGEHQAARRAYEAYVEQYPQEPLPHHRLGILAARESKFAEAEHHLKTATTLGPPSAELISDLGYLYYLMGREDEAEAALRHAIALDRNHAPAHNNLGVLLGIQGRYEESLAEFKQCGTEAQAHANVAYAMTQRGDMEEAEKRYLYALQLDNSLRPAGHAVMHLLERKQVAQNLAANRQKASTPPGFTEPASLPAQALSRQAPQRLPSDQGVEIVTREAPPRMPPQYDAAPVHYQAPLPSEAVASTAGVRQPPHGAPAQAWAYPRR